MKKIKIVVLSLLLFLVTGCSVEYTLDFNNNQLSENIYIDATGSDMTEEEIKKMIELHIYQQNANQLYHINQKNKKIQLSEKYNVYTYKNSLLLNQCYTAYNFIENEDYYDLTTSEIFSCNPFEYMYIDELKIKIKTNHKVLSHNADSVEKGTYIWNITTDNANNKPIQIRFSKEIKEYNIGLIILGITVIIAIIILLIVLIKKQRNNKI